MWSILLGLYLLGGIIVFGYIFCMGIKIYTRAMFKLPNHSKMWGPFNVCGQKLIKDISSRRRYTWDTPDLVYGIFFSGVLGIIFGIIYPIWLLIYFSKSQIRQLIYKIVATKEERIQKALGTDTPDANSIPDIPYK